MTEDVKHPRCCGAIYRPLSLTTASAMNLVSSFDLDADQLGVAADVKVVVLDVAQPVGEVQHGAVRKLDVELFHVEVDGELQGDIRQ